MKIYYLYLLLVLVCISCDTPVKENNNALSVAKISEKSYNSPINPSNPFDDAGKIHNEILTSYYAHSPLPTETDSIVALLHSKATLHPYFSTLTGSLILPQEFEKLENPRLIYFLASVFLASGLAAGAAAFASVGLAAGAGALTSAGLASVGFPAAGLASAGLVVAGALFCVLASSFFSGFADEAPHSLVLLQEVISLDGRRRRRRRSGKEGC